VARRSTNSLQSQLITAIHVNNEWSLSMKLIKNLKFRIIVFSLSLLLGSLAMAAMCGLPSEFVPAIFNNSSSFSEYSKASLETNFSSYAPANSFFNNLIMDNNANANVWAGFDHPDPNMPRLTITPNGFVAPW